MWFPTKNSNCHKQWRREGWKAVEETPAVMRKGWGSHPISNLKGKHCQVGLDTYKKNVYHPKMTCIDFYMLECTKTQSYSSLVSRHWSRVVMALPSEPSLWMEKWKGMSQPNTHVTARTHPKIPADLNTSTITCLAALQMCILLTDIPQLKVEWSQAKERPG